ncbi:MAG: MBOAT family protein [Clostridia bacterium]|nr:MBOAT family protein [Clostridia bacterium]
MSFLSVTFVLFLFIGLVVYYLCPKRFQWLILLALSLIFYCWGGITPVFYVLFTALSVWGGALWMNHIHSNTQAYIKQHKADLSSDDKKQIKKKAKGQQRIIFLTVLLINFGILAVIKYYNFTLSSLWPVFNSNQPFTPVKFLVPMGISFYTFQAISYLIDIYNAKYQAEKNPARFLLFVSFFPQVVQGPIGRYDQLGIQLREGHSYEHKNITHGAILMLWGYFTKMIIADRMAPVVATVFNSPEKYGGCITIIAVFFYAIQLYADFSGGINIVTGAAEMFGISLAPNFKRPYFATSLGDFWHRWHISLGNWMRDYLFYPFAMSKPISAMSKALKKKNVYLSRVLPAVLGNILVFFVVGVWHGAQWSYIFWGLYNGIVLAISAMLEPLFKQITKKMPSLHNSWAWRIFAILRTFAIVCIGYYFDRAPTIGNAFLMLKQSLFNPMGEQLIDGTLYQLGIQLTDYHILWAGMAVIFIISFFQERGVHIREWLDKRNVIIRWGLIYMLIFALILFTMTTVVETESFMYAIF